MILPALEIDVHCLRLRFKLGHDAAQALALGGRELGADVEAVYKLARRLARGGVIQEIHVLTALSFAAWELPVPVQPFARVE
jgi:hypothetical protein